MAAKRFLVLIFVWITPLITGKFSSSQFNYRFGAEMCERLFPGSENYDYVKDVYKLRDHVTCQYCECEPSKQEGGCIRCQPARLSDHIADISTLAEGCYLTRPHEIPHWDLCCPNKKICPRGETGKYFNQSRLDAVRERYKGYQFSLESESPK